MGDYHTRLRPDGSVETLWKFGTCEVWTYVRRSQVEQVRHLDAGKEASVAWALGPLGAWFRFPFPDEDERAKDPRGFDSMFRTAQVRFLPEAEAWVKQLGHGIVQISPPGSQFGPTFNAPCPYGLEAEKLAEAKLGWRWISPAGNTLTVVAERWDEQLRSYTIFGCPYCRTNFNLGESELKQLVIPSELEGRVKARLHDAGGTTA